MVLCTYSFCVLYLPWNGIFKVVSACYTVMLHLVYGYILPSMFLFLWQVRQVTFMMHHYSPFHMAVFELLIVSLLFADTTFPFSI
jgi:hypothetical protein